jgi:tripartite-type tricarboxylate transporter receptor subunit TctC
MTNFREAASIDTIDPILGPFFCPRKKDKFERFFHFAYLRDVHESCRNFCQELISIAEVHFLVRGGYRMVKRGRIVATGIAACVAVTFACVHTIVAWEPTRPIEFVIPAGTGGGADQMARLISGIAEENKLSPRPLIAVNKSGGAGAEGFLYVKEKKSDPHVIIITLSNLFTTPLHTGVPFNWRDLTPVARMALDQFILWVNAETPYKTAKEYLAAAKEKSTGAGRMKMGGTGSAQEDQIITIQLEQALGVKFTYVPFKGGGEVCVNLVGKHVDSTVNNPAECVSHWKAERVRPLGVFDTSRIPDGDWKAIPTIKEALGADIHYQMLRGIFAAPGIAKEAVQWHVDFLKKVFDSAKFKKYLTDGALKPAFSTGPEYVKWVDENEKLHRELMAKEGLLKK